MDELKLFHMKKALIQGKILELDKRYKEQCAALETNYLNSKRALNKQLADIYVQHGVCWLCQGEGTYFCNDDHGIVCRVVCEKCNGTGKVKE